MRGLLLLPSRLVSYVCWHSGARPKPTGSPASVKIISCPSRKKRAG